METILLKTTFRIFVSGLIFLGLPSNAEQVSVPGSRINMDRPDGFEKATNFSGFQNPSLRASIMVTELPGPFLQVSSGFEPGPMANRGMTLCSKTPHKVGSLEGILVELKQTASGLEFHKWVLAFGDNKSTTLITAAFPEDSATTLSEKMKHAVLTAVFDSTKPEPLKQQDLNFSVSGVTGLKLAARLQNALIFNASGALPKEKLKATATSFVAAQALHDLEIDDRAQYARRRLRQTTGMHNFEIISENNIEIAGLSGREILAKADSDMNEKLFVYQTMLFGRGSYFIMQGTTDYSQKEAHELMFKSIAKTFKLK